VKDQPGGYLDREMIGHGVERQIGPS